MEEIQSESKFIWKLILHILLTPLTLLLILFKKKEFSELFQPFKDIVKFIFEPKFTISIIAINILIFFIYPFNQLTQFVNYPTDILSIRAYTLITAGFLHVNLTHLIGNMIGIFIFGRVIERKLGFWKTSLIYFSALILSSLFSSTIHLLTKNNIGGAGASGALMGLIAAAILLDPLYITYEMIIPLPIMAAGWLAIYGDISGILNPIEDGIGHLAHIGGFISIAVTMYLLGVEERQKLKKGLLINIISLIVAVAIYLLLTKQNFYINNLPPILP